MSEHEPATIELGQVAESASGTDARQQRFGYGRGGVPFLLLFLYLGFLTFFTWYVLNYQLPDYLEHGPGRAGANAQPKGD